MNTVDEVNDPAVSHTRLLEASPRTSVNSTPVLSSSSSMLRQRNSTEEAQAVRLNVLNSSVQEAREASNTRAIMIFLTVLSVPQLIASIIIMGLYWNKASECNRVRIWVLLKTIHIFTTIVVEWVVYILENREDLLQNYHSRVSSFMNNTKYMLELLGLFLFLVGNMWIISENRSCGDAGTPMYHLAISLIVISYVRIFFPCIILLALLPVICFCLPCVIRILHRITDPMAGKGASKDVINNLEEKLYSPSMVNDTACCICLCDYEQEEKVRILPCQHHFHTECVDEWLRINATCPTCREPIVKKEESSEDVV